MVGESGASKTARRIWTYDQSILFVKKK